MALFPFVWRTYNPDRPVGANSNVGARGVAKDRLSASGYVWVPKQYITSERPRSLIIAGLKRKVAELAKNVKYVEKVRTALLKQIEVLNQNHTAKVKPLEKSIREKRKEISHATQELRQITDKYNKVLEQSKKVVKLVHERDDLRATSQRFRADNDMKMSCEGKPETAFFSLTNYI